jgi:hypothetical protein
VSKDVVFNAIAQMKTPTSLWQGLPKRRSLGRLGRRPHPSEDGDEAISLQ